MAASADPGAPSRRSRRQGSRRLRRAFAGAAALVASADIAVATAVPGNALRLPSVPPETRPGMLAYGVFLLVVAAVAVATSAGADAAAESPEAAPEAPVPPVPTLVAPPADGEEREVMHALRMTGWYVADDVLLPHVAVDHVAIGPAGVLAVQVMWTDRQQNRGDAAARARIAAGELRKMLAAKELPIDVVPAVLAFGPGLTDEPGGVKVVDSVAILFGNQADLWVRELSRRRLLHEHTVDAVRSVVADLREGINRTVLPTTGALVS